MLSAHQFCIEIVVKACHVIFLAIFKGHQIGPLDIAFFGGGISIVGALRLGERVFAARVGATAEADGISALGLRGKLFVLAVTIGVGSCYNIPVFGDSVEPNGSVHIA